jgi:hypothetical protein
MKNLFLLRYLEQKGDMSCSLSGAEKPKNLVVESLTFGPGNKMTTAI